jgi:hypothetical protein
VDGATGTATRNGGTVERFAPVLLAAGSGDVITVKT